jgi:hypothetical protein
MGLFDFLKSHSGQSPSSSQPQREEQIPIAQVDLSKRYDVYCFVGYEDRLYRNIRFVCIRTFEKMPSHASFPLCAYFEIEAVDGARMLISTYNIQLICEHGVEPVFETLRIWAPGARTMGDAAKP